MTRPLAGLTGALALLLAWAVVPALGWPGFSGHMTTHLLVVALAAPLLALAVAGGRLDPVPRAPALFAAVPASVVELLAVWGWHSPGLHRLAREHAAAWALEQATFLGVGLLLWLSVLGGGGVARRERVAAGVVALLLTSMHMTLLGALVALTGRPLYADDPAGLSRLEDQRLGGALMLVVGSGAYLAGGLALTARLLRDPEEAPP